MPVAALSERSNISISDMTSTKCNKCNDAVEGRNLVVCIDGTANQFGNLNTNLVELYHRLVQDKTQLSYYTSGIGTLARPSWQSYSFWKLFLSNIIDLAIAWNFEKGVQDAYRWLAENYEQGDRIYLFGFSRGAYQVRALAAMIDRVGLLRKGNQEQVALYMILFKVDDQCSSSSNSAYEIYRKDGSVKNDDIITGKMKSTTVEYSMLNIFELMLRRNIYTILNLLLNLLILGWTFLQFYQLVLTTSERNYLAATCFLPGVLPGKTSLLRLFNFFWISIAWFRLYHLTKRGLTKGIQMLGIFDSRYRRVRYPQTSAEHLRKTLWSAGVLIGLFSRELEVECDDSDAVRFKATFSRKDVRVHFIGAWDTVSSIGFVRGKELPGTSKDLGHICYFRHALALDERRVKFLPEYAHGMIQKVQEPKYEESPEDRLRPHIKEVWFPGTHSDIGGGNVYNANLSRRHPAFLWMCYEATLAGLAIESDDVEWNWEQLGVVHESLSSTWKVFEAVPFRRPSYARLGFNSHPCSIPEFNRSWNNWVMKCCTSLLSYVLSFVEDDPDYTHWPHYGQGREIMPGQKVHISVAFCPPTYLPKALLPNTFTKPWEFIVYTGDKSEDGGLGRNRGWDTQFVEMDIFDHSLAETIVDNISREGSDTVMWVHRLTAMAWGRWGCRSLSRVPGVTARLLKRVQSFETKTQAAVMGVVFAIETTLRTDDHLEYLQVLKELSQNAEFLQTLLCDGDLTQGKFSILWNVLDNDDLRHWILQKGTLEYLFTKLKNGKLGTRNSTCAVLVGLGIHEDVQNAILGCDDSRTFDALLATGIDWSLLRVIAGLANSKSSKISRLALVYNLFDGLRKRVRGGWATNDEIGSILSAIAELAHHEDVRLVIADGIDPMFCDCLIHLLKDKDADFHQAATDIIWSLTKYDNTRSTLSRFVLAPLVTLLGRAKYPVPILRIIVGLMRYEDVCRKVVVNTKFVQALHRRVSIENGCVLRDICTIFEELTGHGLSICSGLVDAHFYSLSVHRLQDNDPFVQYCALRLVVISSRYHETKIKNLDAIVPSLRRILKDNIPYICVEVINTILAMVAHGTDHTRFKMLDLFLSCLKGLLRIRVWTSAVRLSRLWAR